MTSVGTENTKEHLIYLAKKYKDTTFEATKKEMKKNASEWSRVILQTWIKQCLNGSWLFEAEM